MSSALLEAARQGGEFCPRIMKPMGEEENTLRHDSATAQTRPLLLVVDRKETYEYAFYRSRHETYAIARVIGVTPSCAQRYGSHFVLRGIIFRMDSSPKSWQTFKIGDRVRALDYAPADYRGRAGVIRGIRHGSFDFLVEFPERSPEFGYMRGEWLVQIGTGDTARLPKTE